MLEDSVENDCNVILNTSNQREFSAITDNNNDNNNNNNNFISIAFLSYVQGALQSCEQHY